MPLLCLSRPSLWGVRGIRQMNTFKSNSTQTDNSPTAMPPAPLGRDMVVLCLISPAPRAQFRSWPRQWMWRQRSHHSPQAHRRRQAHHGHAKVKSRTKPMCCKSYTRMKRNVQVQRIVWYFSNSEWWIIHLFISLSCNKQIYVRVSPLLERGILGAYQRPYTVIIMSLGPVSPNLQ